MTNEAQNPNDKGQMASERQMCLGISIVANGAPVSRSPLSSPKESVVVEARRKGEVSTSGMTGQTSYAMVY
jgi:hypothetical protein